MSHRRLRFHARLFIQIVQNLNLLFVGASHKIFAERALTSLIDIRQACQECRFLLLVIPVCGNQIDELIHPRLLRPWRIGLRNNQFADSRDGCILVGIQRLERRSLRKLLVHFLEQ